MGQLSESAVSLWFFGDDLDPAYVGRLLGASGYQCAVKGERTTNAKTGRVYVARTGRWGFKVERREPADLDAQIRELFDALSGDLAVWRDLSSRFRAQLFVGLFMLEGNEGVVLSVESLGILSARMIPIDFDIYGPLSQPDDATDDATAPAA